MSASVRFRARWPAKYMVNADCYDGTQRLADYNAFVFQKFYLTDKARTWIRTFRAAGATLAFDLCDADWLLSETHYHRLFAVLPLFDFAVAPTRLLVDWLNQWLPTYFIPDRLDLEMHTERHEHNRGSAPSLIWFGNSANLVTLEEMWPTVSELGLSLTILADQLVKPWDSRDITFVKWTLEGANAEIARHDIALNPKINYGHFAYKSENKTVTAWALGVPVAKTLDELAQLLNYDVRVDEASRRLQEVAELWDVRISADAWNMLPWVKDIKGVIINEGTFRCKK